MEQNIKKKDSIGNFTHPVQYNALYIVRTFNMRSHVVRIITMYLQNAINVSMLYACCTYNMLVIMMHMSQNAVGISIVGGIAVQFVLTV